MQGLWHVTCLVLAGCCRATGGGKAGDIQFSLDELDAALQPLTQVCSDVPCCKGLASACMPAAAYLPSVCPP